MSASRWPPPSGSPDPPIGRYRSIRRGISRDVRAWSTRTADGLTLRGWYLPTEKSRHLIVLVHGMWSSWLEMAGLGRDLHR